VIFLDFETRSRVDLKVHGGRRYAAGPHSAVLCGVAIMGDDVYTWSPFGDIGPRWIPSADAGGTGFVYHEPLLGSDDPPQPILDAVAAGVPVVAHNAHGFDRHVWDQLDLPTARWIDSVELARRASLPAGLEKLGAYLFGIPKDKAGRRVMLLHALPLTKPKSVAGKFRDPDAGSLAEIVRYCITDVLVMRRAVIEESLAEPHIDDAVLEAHRRIDDRGVCVDLPAVHALLRADRADAAKHIQAAFEATGGVIDKTALNSPAQLLRWLRTQGIDLPDTKRATIERELETATEAVRAVLKARLAVARVTSGKAQAILDRVCPDGRLRGMLAYYGAHTGRWAGRGFQPQNLPRGVADVPIDCDADDAPKVAQRLGVDTADVLGTMLRGLLVPPPGHVFVIVDYSSIEARVLLWCAGDEVGLQRYRDGADEYKRVAARIFDCAVADVTKAQRGVGKVTCLAAGYGGGEGAFRGYAEKVALELPEGLEPTDVIEAWRDANELVAGERTGAVWVTDDGRTVYPRAGGLWKETMKAAKAATGFPKRPAPTPHSPNAQLSYVTHAGKCGWHHDGKHLLCTLPSGRKIVYRDAAIEDAPTRWGTVKPQLVFHHPVWKRGTTWHGSLVENLVSGIARDLLADAIVRLEDQGFKVAFHVHDEVVVSVPERSANMDLDYVEQIMCDTPDWARGLPVEVEGQIASRFTK